MPALAMVGTAGANVRLDEMTRMQLFEIVAERRFSVAVDSTGVKHVVIVSGMQINIRLDNTSIALRPSPSVDG